MPEPLQPALAELRALLVDLDHLVAAVAAGRRRGQPAPPWRRVRLRPVGLRDGLHLQVVSQDERTANTRNLAPGPQLDDAIEALLAEPFGNWHVQTTETTVQLRVTKRGEAQVHRSSGAEPASREHDRAKPRLLDPGDPLFEVVGGGADKRRQVDAFLRLLSPTVADAFPAGTELSVADLGCGNAYLTFAAHRFLSAEHAVRTTGIDVRERAAARNAELAHRLGVADRVDFRAEPIATASLPGADVALALHACDTATDDALARAVRWGAPVVLAAPCCHHDIQAQLRARPAPPPYGALTRHPVLLERFADTLTDALRAAILRLLGYRVEVVEFIASRHTPRNLMIRAVRTGAPPRPERVAEYVELTSAWAVRPRLAELLSDLLDPVLANAGVDSANAGVDSASAAVDSASAAVDSANPPAATAHPGDADGLGVSPARGSDGGDPVDH